MIERVLRALPLLALALVVGALSTGSLAIAGGNQDEGLGEHHKSGDDAQRSDKRCDQDGYSAWDEQWLKMSIEGDLFEIRGGKLAMEKAKTDKVRELGRTLVKDHTESLKDATDLAEELGIEVPSEPSPTQQWQLRAVAQFSGKEFDRWYSDLEVQDHKQDIQEAKEEVDKGCNDSVREEAAKEIPTLERHLSLAERALESVS
jgi:putative membrane protein